jgi:hypothetical protein
LATREQASPAISEHSESSMVAFKRTRWLEEDDVIPISLKALREIFRDVNPRELLEDLPTCLAGDSKAIKENKVFYDE